MENNAHGSMDAERLAADRAGDAALVARVRDGDESAFGELYDRWIDRVHDLAFRIVGDAAADVAHDAFLSSWHNLDSLRDPASFGGWLLRSARNAALNRLERDRRAQAVDAEGLEMIEARAASGAGAGLATGLRAEDRLGAADDPARAVEDAEAVALVWESAEALGERDATVLDLTLRHGMTPMEVGEVVGVNRNAANQLVHRVRNRLGDAVRARVLWHGGSPRCADLAALLADAGIERFDADAVRVTTAHVDTCEACEERRRLRLAPAALFGAIPILGVPAVLNQRVAAALVDDGVPMEGSEALGAHGPTGVVSRILSRRPAAVVAGIGTLVVLALLAAWTIAAGDDDGETTVQAPATSTSTTTTTVTTSTTTVPDVAPTTPADTPPATDAPVMLPLPDAPPPEVTLRITEVQSQSVYTESNAPRLVWSVVGGAVVEVTGPNFPTSYEASGDEALCPTAGEGWTSCPAESGSWDYTVRVFDASGTVVAQESVTLTHP